MGRTLRANLPGAQIQYDFNQFLNPEAKEGQNFSENLLLQTGIYGGWSGKEAFDYRGRNYDIGEASPLTPDGMIKMFEKSDRADLVDQILAKAGYSNTDVDQKNDAYWFVDEQGMYYPQNLNPDKQYEFRKRAADIFNEKLLEYSDGLNTAINLTDLESYTPEEIVRYYASQLHTLSNQQAYEEIMADTNPDFKKSDAEKKLDERLKEMERTLIGIQTGIDIPLQIDKTISKLPK